MKTGRSPVRCMTFFVPAKAGTHKARQGGHMTQAQLKAVWATARAKGIDGDTLHDIITNLFGVKSLKKITVSQGARLLGYLNGQTVSPDYASVPQSNKITALFDALGFSEPKRIEWIFRAKSLRAEMNVSGLPSDKLVRRIKAREATALIASLVKLQKYLEAKG